MDSTTATAFYDVVEHRLVIDRNFNYQAIRQLIRQWDTLQNQHGLTELEVDVRKVLCVWTVFASKFLPVALTDLTVFQLNSCQELDWRNLRLLFAALLQGNCVQTLSLCADFKRELEDYVPDTGAMCGELLGFPTCRIQKLTLTLSSEDFDARSFELFTEGLRRHPVGMQRLTLHFVNCEYDAEYDAPNLGDHDLAALVSALLHRSDTTLQSLSLQGARRRLTRSSFAVLARLLDHCPLLEELQVSNLGFLRAVDGYISNLGFLRAVDGCDDDASDPFLEFASALARKQESVFQSLSLKHASCLDLDDLHRLLEALTVVKTLKMLDIVGIMVADVTPLLVLYLPRLNGLEILHVNAAIQYAECGELGQALWQNSSLLTLNVCTSELSGSPNRSSNSSDGPYSFVRNILQRNAVLRGVLVRYLDNRRRLSPTNWPFCAAQLLAACKDVTPLFLFLRATANHSWFGWSNYERRKRGK